MIKNFRITNEISKILRTGDKAISYLLKAMFLYFEIFLKFQRHPALVPRLNPPRKVSRWKWGIQSQSSRKRFGFSTSPLCIGNLSHPEKNFDLLMFPSGFLRFWHFLSDIAQTVFGPWLAALVLKDIQAVNSCFTMEGFMWTFLT